MTHTKPASRGGAIRGTRRLRAGPETRPTATRGHVLRLVAKSGDARELHFPPVDLESARRLAERAAKLAGRLLAPALARGSVVVLVSINTTQEVERFPVRVPRRRNQEPTAPVETVAKPSDRDRRYAILRECPANVHGHKILASVRRLLTQLEAFDKKAHGGHTWNAFRLAGFPEADTYRDPSGMGFDETFFEGLEGDVSGFWWVLETFAQLVESNLVLPPTRKEGEK